MLAWDHSLGVEAKSNIEEDTSLRASRKSQKASSTKPKSKHKKKRFEEVGEAFNEGQSIQDLMQRWDVKARTVLKNMMTYMQEGNHLKVELLEAEVILPPEQRRLVIAKFQEISTEKLAPVYEALKGEVSYDQLSLMRLIFLHSRF